MKNWNRTLRLKAILISILLVLIPSLLEPCTVAVVSGRATPDGRALLWKNRDTGNPNNKLVYVKGKKYAFLGVVNASDNEAQMVWQGINSNGFAIMNSLSRDLTDDPKGFSENGIFMRRALGECADVEEFEALLVQTNTRRKVAANYGVIDAKGNACLYETGADSFTKFDANDPRISPQGYILRTNYAFTSPKKMSGGGYIRFERVSHLFQRAAAEGRLDYRFILQVAARDLVNEKLHSYPFSQPSAHDPAEPLYIRTNDTLNRISTVSVSIFHGAPSPDKAYLATMWTMLGQPISTVAVPFWVSAGAVPDAFGGEKTAPVNDLAKTIVAYLYPDQRANMKQYMNITRLLTYGGNGVLGRLFAIENEVIEATEDKVEEWLAVEPDSRTVAAYMFKTAEWVYQHLQESFAEIIE